MKWIGKRSAGNPHAAFDVAGAGNAFGARQSLTLQAIRSWCLKFGPGHAAVYNLFNLSRHLNSARNFRNLRIASFNEWKLAVV